MIWTFNSADNKNKNGIDCENFIRLITTIWFLDFIFILIYFFNVTNLFVYSFLLLYFFFNFGIVEIKFFEIHFLGFFS